MFEYGVGGGADVFGQREREREREGSWLGKEVKWFLTLRDQQLSRVELNLL